MNTRIDQSADDELLKLLAGPVNLAPTPVLISMGLLAWMLAPITPTVVWVGWYILVILGQITRWAIFSKQPKLTKMNTESRLRLAIWVYIGNSLLHSLPLLFFPQFTPFQRALLSMITLGLGAVTIFTAAGFRPITLTHIIIGLLPLIGMWAWVSITGEFNPIEFVICLLLLGYAATMLVVAQRIWNMMHNAYATRSQLSKALEQAETADKGKSRFLAAASHDLRQPMHTLALYSAALGMREMDSKAQHIVKNIDAAVEALANQLDALLDVSKLDAGIVQVHSSPFNLHPLLCRITEEFSPLGQENGISVNFKCPLRATANTDIALLERVLRNLMANAIKHNKDCSIHLNVVASDGVWQLTVEDTGVGIPKNEQENIFEEFYQLQNPEREQSKGLGLGLSIVNRLTMLLDIPLELRSEPGQGTCFKLSIPVGVSKPSERERERVQASDQPSLESLTILVVDDQEAVRDGMKTLLETLGCRVIIAEGTLDALAAISGQLPDIALVDYRLRGDDSGLITIRKLREQLPWLPALILSGETAPEKLQEVRESGITMLSKPVLIEPLKRAIIECCGLET
ncbi:MAG: hybrid sensor histidine kinase/response regulator [Halioglobus sp.]